MISVLIFRGWIGNEHYRHRVDPILCSGRQPPMGLNKAFNSGSQHRRSAYEADFDNLSIEHSEPDHAFSCNPCIRFRELLSAQAGIRPCDATRREPSQKLHQPKKAPCSHNSWFQNCRSLHTPAGPLFDRCARAHHNCLIKSKPFNAKKGLVCTTSLVSANGSAT